MKMRNYMKSLPGRKFLTNYRYIGINVDLFFRVCQAMGRTTKDFFPSMDRASQATTMGYMSHLGTVASGKSLTRQPMHCQQTYLSLAAEETI